MLRLNYRKVLDHNATHVASLAVRSDSASTSRSFVASFSADAFLRDGFMADSANVTVYHGPDADVLLDEAFLHGYCFRLAAHDPARPTQVALRFAPATSRSGRVDIEGTVWMDTVARSVIGVEYRYRGLDRRDDAFTTGGNVSFLSMPNGVTVIDRWWIRYQLSGPPRDGRDYSALRVAPRIIAETGGELAVARWSGEGEPSMWHGHLGTARGTLRRADGVAPYTVVRLADTDYATITDSLGAFTFENLIPGPYTVLASDPSLSALGLILETTTSFTAIRDSAVIIEPRVTTAAEYSAAVCRGALPGQPVVVGRVVDAGNEEWLARQCRRQRVQRRWASYSLHDCDDQRRWILPDL